MNPCDSILEDVIRKTVADLGCELWWIDWCSHKRAVTRIYIDKKGGVTADDCGRVGKQVQAVLAVEAPSLRALEISSPGVSRRLYCRAHYERYIGHDIHVRLQQVEAEGQRFTGQLMNVTKDELTVEVAGEKRTVAVRNIVKAQVEDELERGERDE